MRSQWRLQGIPGVRECACLLALLASTLAATGCNTKPQARAEAAAEKNPAEVTITPSLQQFLKFGTPQMADVHGTLQVTARVETNAKHVAHVSSPVKGRILKLLVFEGEYVKAGTVLATLHSTELSDAQFALVKAVSQQSLAAAAEKRAQQLLAADVIGQAELERRRAELLQAATQAESYHTELLGLGMTEAQIKRLETTHRLSADYPIVSPKAGTVLRRDITIGQVVQPADPAFTIADLSTLWITANVPEEDAGQLHKGLQVQVRIPALPKQSITGQLSFVSPIVDPATRTVAVHMDVANRNGLLKPDELASMTFTGKAERKLTVPSSAIVREDNKDSVFVRIGPQKYVLREVFLGEEQGDRRVVLSGLRGDEQIVTDGAFHLNNQRKQNAIQGGD